MTAAGAVDWERHEAEAFGLANEQSRPERPRRVVRQRPSRRYDSPEEMWAWHSTRMLIAGLWTVLGTLGGVCTTTAVIFYVELF